MSEILTQAGAEWRIVYNDDETYTAYIAGKQQTFDDIKEAVAWCMAVRDGDQR